MTEKTAVSQIIRLAHASRGRPARMQLNLTAILGWGLVGVALLIALLAPLLAPADPWDSLTSPFTPPGGEYPLGTDDLGRDLLSGVIYATRTSLIVGLSATFIATTIGMTLGAAAGFYGGLMDDFLMRFTEFFQVIPRFFLALIAVALFEPGLVTITIVLGLTSWTLTARLLRSQILAAREREYVIAARALGARNGRILWRHILPNTITPIIVHTSLMIGQFILIESSLAFLGLGDPNNISWGYMLQNAQPFLRLAWWMSFFPGLAVALTVLGFNLLGDNLQDMLDPYRTNRKNNSTI